MSALLKLIATAAIATAIASPSIAGTWAKIERPCTSNCIPPRPVVSSPPAWAVVGGVPFREIKEPTYQSRTVITSSYGTSVYTFRSYSR